MTEFALLWLELDRTNRVQPKVSALRSYFLNSHPADAAWALALLTGKRPRVPVKRGLLRRWACEEAGIPDWLFEESYGAVGDLSETLSLVLPDPTTSRLELGLAEWMDWMRDLARKDEDAQQLEVVRVWRALPQHERFLLHKFMGGSFRVGVSKELVIRALSEASGLPTSTLAHRLMGQWEPTAAFFADLLAPGESSHASLPYPFCLAHPMEGQPMELGDIRDWQFEPKWDGIRAQLIHRQGQTFLWSRGEEMIQDVFPEITQAGHDLPEGTVLDGEILAWKEGAPQPFSELQRRLGRKTVGKKLLTEVPCALLTFDLLEFRGEDWRQRPLSERTAQLDELIHQQANAFLRLSPIFLPKDWNEAAVLREGSREARSEGLMIKRRDSIYGIGRRKGQWWKWKLDPFTVDAVLLYAQKGTGKRANLYTDYTFGVWQDGKLVSFAKAYSGLSDDEIRRVDTFIRENILEKFGPVRTVKPQLVFELAFEGIQLSNRHKSGVAVRFPRILKWREDKKPEDADTLERIHDLLRHTKT